MPSVQVCWMLLVLISTGVTYCLVLSVGVCSTQGAVRLVNGTNSSEGRVELCIGDGWGTVCDIDAGWNQSEANQLCGQLGFSRHSESNPRKD